MSNFQWVAVAVVTVLSAARLTRLVTYDSFPPVAYLRDRFIDLTDKSERGRSWQLVAYCGYCASFWMTLLVLLSGWGLDWPTWWWILNGALGASYLAAIVMVHDGDDPEPVSGNEDES